MKNIASLSVGSILLLLAGFSGIVDPGFAQQSTSPCPPPQPNEYLIVVTTPTTESQEQLQQTLPANTKLTVCRYLDDTVTRIAGFRRLEDANDWVRYVKEVVGLKAYVVRSSTAVAATAPLSNIPPFNPQPLGEGYAVLVDYNNQPEIAAQIQQLLGSEVGLVSYGKRPYLLAIYTTSERAANSMLRKLSDRGFWSMVVDSRRVTLLKPVVKF